MPFSVLPFKNSYTEYLSSEYLLTLYWKDLARLKRRRRNSEDSEFDQLQKHLTHDINSLSLVLVNANKYNHGVSKLPKNLSIVLVCWMVIELSFVF